LVDHETKFGKQSRERKGLFVVTSVGRIGGRGA
jgi:hypothetical protein